MLLLNQVILSPVNNIIKNKILCPSVTSFWTKKEVLGLVPNTAQRNLKKWDSEIQIILCCQNDQISHKLDFGNCPNSLQEHFGQQ